MKFVGEGVEGVGKRATRTLGEFMFSSIKHICVRRAWISLPIERSVEGREEEDDIFHCSLSFTAENFRFQLWEFIKLHSRAFVYFILIKSLQIFCLFIITISIMWSEGECACSYVDIAIMYDRQFKQLSRNNLVFIIQILDSQLHVINYFYDFHTGR